MGWPGAFQGAAGGALAGLPFAPPWGALAGAGVGGLAGAFGGGGGKGGLSKFGAKRGKKAMKAAARQEVRTAKRMAKLGRKEAPKVAKQQMDINEDWIRRQQKIHPEALNQQRKYQNKAAKKQIPINAKLAGMEDRRAYERELQRNQYANELRIHNEPMREAAAAENRSLFEKFGMPHKYEEEKFYKKSLLTPEQKQNLAFQNQQGMQQKEYRDIAQNPLYQQALGTLSQQLDRSPEGIARRDAPFLQNFQNNVLPQVMNEANAARGGQKGGHLARARVGAQMEYQNKRDMMREAMENSALEKILGYTGAATASRQQEIQNAQHNAQLGLGRQGFERMYKPALYATPQGGTLAGGVQFNQAAAAPSMAGVGQAQFSPLNTPSVNLGGGGQNYGQFFQQGGAGGGGFPGFNQFLAGAGQGAGTAAGNAYADKFKNLFSGSAPNATAGNASSGPNPMNGQGGFSGGGWVPM